MQLFQQIAETAALAMDALRNRVLDAEVSEFMRVQAEYYCYLRKANTVQRMLEQRVSFYLDLM